MHMKKFKKITKKFKKKNNIEKKMCKIKRMIGLTCGIIWFHYFMIRFQYWMRQDI